MDMGVTIAEQVVARDNDSGSLVVAAAATTTSREDTRMGAACAAWVAEARRMPGTCERDW